MRCSAEASGDALFGMMLSVTLVRGWSVCGEQSMPRVMGEGSLISGFAASACGVVMA